MAKLLHLLVVALAAWRVTYMLVHEEGPFEIFDRIRWLAGIRYDEVSIPYASNGIAGAFLCVFCLSVWVGLLFAFLSPFYTADIRSYIVNALSISALIIVLDNLISRTVQEV